MEPEVHPSSHTSRVTHPHHALFPGASKAEWSPWHARNSPVHDTHLICSKFQEWRDADLRDRQHLVDDTGGFRHLRVVVLLEGLGVAHSDVNRDLM